MAIKFQDKKPDGTGTKPKAEAPAKPAAAAPPPAPTASEPAKSDSNLELPFAKPVRPEKKSRRK